MQISNDVRLAILKYLRAYQTEKEFLSYSEKELRELDSLISIFENGVDPLVR